MREYASPSLDDPYAIRGVTARTLVDDVVRRGQADPDAVVASTRSDGRWSPVTAARLLADVRAQARRFVAAGLRPGDRVALLSRTRYEWTVADFALWAAGCVSVPLYDTSAQDQVRHILGDSGARAVLTGSDAHRDTVAAARGDLPDLELVLDLLEEGAGADPELDQELERRLADLGPDTLATLVYTSGSTGAPRGCRLHHSHLLFGSAAIAAVLGPVLEEEDASTLLFLPLAHVLTRLVQVTAVRAGLHVGYADDLRRLIDDLASFRPTFLVGVPRVFERIYTVTSQRASADGRGRLFDRATDTAITWSQAMETPRGPGPVLRARHAAFDRLVYRHLRESLGGRLHTMLAGGAPLGDRLGHLFRGAGIPVLEGYGLTETSSASTLTAPDEVKVGRVGRPLPGTAVRVSRDGELLVRGPHVFAGYWGDDDEGKGFTDDGVWLRTGDLGEIDDEGFVRITGRMREMLVTTGGKNVAPGPLEDAVRSHPLVAQCLVVGDARPFVAALVTLDHDAVRAWAESNGRPVDVAALAADDDLLAEIQTAVDRANERVSQAESIRRWAVLPVEWTEETGDVTPSLKLRRHVVLRRHRADVDELFR